MGSPKGILHNLLTDYDRDRLNKYLRRSTQYFDKKTGRRLGGWNNAKIADEATKVLGRRYTKQNVKKSISVIVDAHYKRQKAAKTSLIVARPIAEQVCLPLEYPPLPHAPAEYAQEEDMTPAAWQEEQEAAPEAAVQEYVPPPPHPRVPASAIESLRVAYHDAVEARNLWDRRMDELEIATAMVLCYA